MIYIADENDEGKTLGTALTLSVLSAILCIFGVYSFTCFFNAGEKETIFVCVLYSTMLIFQALELVIYWFQAHLLSKYVALLSFAAYLIVSAYKTYLLIEQKNVAWFAVSNAIDYCLISFGLLGVYKKLGGQPLKFSIKKSKRLLSGSWTYIISGLMATVYAQTDKVMLNNITGNTEVGLYSAAISCITLVSFVFSAIIDSMRPHILSKKNTNTREYEKSVVCLYSIVFYLSMAYCLFCFIFGEFIIQLLYGENFVLSVSILRLLAWYGIFNYIGGAQSVWFLAEGKQKYLTVMGTTGALLNVILNYILIPQYGCFGAAIATLVTSFVANIALCIVIKPLRNNSVLLMKALNPRFLISNFIK